MQVAGWLVSWRASVFCPFFLLSLLLPRRRPTRPGRQRQRRRRVWLALSKTALGARAARDCKRLQEGCQRVASVFVLWTKGSGSERRGHLSGPTGLVPQHAVDASFLHSLPGLGGGPTVIRPHSRRTGLPTFVPAKLKSCSVPHTHHTQHTPHHPSPWLYRSILLLLEHCDDVCVRTRKAGRCHSAALPASNLGVRVASSHSVSRVASLRQSSHSFPRRPRHRHYDQPLNITLALHTTKTYLNLLFLLVVPSETERASTLPRQHRQIRPFLQSRSVSHLCPRSAPLYLLPPAPPLSLTATTTAEASHPTNAIRFARCQHPSHRGIAFSNHPFALQLHCFKLLLYCHWLF
jgi:hypothetical protein